MESKCLGACAAVFGALIAGLWLISGGAEWIAIHIHPLLTVVLISVCAVGLTLPFAIILRRQLQISMKTRHDTKR